MPGFVARLAVSYGDSHVFLSSDSRMGVLVFSLHQLLVGSCYGLLWDYDCYVDCCSMLLYGWLFNFILVGFLTMFAFAIPPCYDTVLLFIFLTSL